MEKKKENYTLNKISEETGLIIPRQQKKKGSNTLTLGLVDL